PDQPDRDGPPGDRPGRPPGRGGGAADVVRRAAAPPGRRGPAAGRHGRPRRCLPGVPGHRPVRRVAGDALTARRPRPDPPWSPRPSARDLVREVGPVFADLPRFVVAPFGRRRHQTWGATPDEVAAAMPGDDLLPRAQYRTTRAVTVRAEPAEIWPWLGHVGYRPAGGAATA